MRRNSTRAGLVGLIVLLATSIIGCGPREGATGGSNDGSHRRERNAELPATSLVNGSFTLNGGGWTSNGFSLAKGCQGSGGDPSLGGWQKDALAFGYSRQTVSQAVRIMTPSTVTLRIFGAVRSDQANSNFVVSLAGAGQSVTTGPQTGYPLTTPQEFTLSVATRTPGDLVTVSIEGSSASYWGGCYGPIVTNARLEIVDATSSASSASSTTNLTPGSTTSVSPTSLPSPTVVPPASTTSTSTPSVDTTTSTTVAAPTSTLATATSLPVSSSAPTRIIPAEVRGDGRCELSPGGLCTDANVEYVSKTGVNLQGLRASGSDFTDANFSGSDLTGADLHMARFLKLTVDGTKFDSANLVGAMFGWLRSNEPRFQLKARPPSFANANLAHSKLYGVDLSKANLRSASFVGADLSGAILDNADLDGADLRGAILTELRSQGIRASNVKLPSGYSLMNGAIVGPGVDLSIEDFKTWREPKMSESFLRPTQVSSRTCATLYAEIHRSDFQPTNFGAFRGASFRKMNLTGVDFGGLDLAGADFTGADLTRVNFSGANLSRTNFADATVVDVDFSRAVLSGARLDRPREFKNIRSSCTMASSSDPAQLPRGWKLDQSVTRLTADRRASVQSSIDHFSLLHGFILGPTAQLAFANLSGLDLKGIDLSAAELGGVATAAVDGVGVEPRRQSVELAKLPPGYVWNRDIVLGPEADLRGVVLDGNVLGTVDLSDARLTGSTTRNLKGDPLLPFGWKLVSGVLLGRETVYENLDLSGASLSGVDLTDSTLIAAKINTANLRGLHTENTSFVSSKNLWPAPPMKFPPGYQYVSGYLLGPGVNATGSNIDFTTMTKPPTLNRMDLSSAVLDGSKWRGVKAWIDLPMGWALDAKGNLFGPSANLQGLDGSLPGLDTRRVSFPPEYALVGGRLFGPRLLLSSSQGLLVRNVDLSGATVSSDFFTTSKLEMVKGSGVVVTGAKSLNGWGVTKHGYLVGPSVDLSDAKLDGDSVPISDLSNAMLDGVHGVNVTFVDPLRLRLPRGWRYERGLLLGPTADLSGANLSGLKLDDDLSNAILEDARGTNITGRPKLPEGWSIVDGTLVGPKANLVCGKIVRSQVSGAYAGEFGSYFDPSEFGVDRPSAPLC